MAGNPGEEAARWGDHPGNYTWVRIIMTHLRRGVFKVRFEGDHGTGSGEIDIPLAGTTLPLASIAVGRQLALEHDCEVVIELPADCQPRRLVIPKPPEGLLGGTAGMRIVQ